MGPLGQFLRESVTNRLPGDLKLARLGVTIKAWTPRCQNSPPMATEQQRHCRSTGKAKRIGPCESSPRRLALIRSRAMMSAWSCGSPALAKTAAEKARRSSGVKCSTVIWKLSFRYDQGSGSRFSTGRRHGAADRPLGRHLPHCAGQFCRRVREP